MPASRVQADATAKRYALKALAIPRLLPSTVWTRPASNALKKLRTIMTDTLMGRYRRARCPEVVMAILSDPIRDDPWGAMIVNALLAARRILRKDADRLDGFLGYIAKMLSTGDLLTRPADGPMYGVLRAIGDLQVSGTINVERQEFVLRQENGPPIDLFHRSTAAIKGAIRRWVRVTILEGLSLQCNGKESRRKDMVGISGQVNVAATRSLLGLKRAQSTASRLNTTDS